MSHGSYNIQYETKSYETEAKYSRGPQGHQGFQRVDGE